MLKRLDELSDHELTVEYEKSGLEGNFDEVQCLIRMTIYLVKLGMDPFTFQFNVEEEFHKSQDIEDGCEAQREEPNSTAVFVTAVPSLWLAEGMSSEQSSVSSPVTLPGGSSLISDNAGSALLCLLMLTDVCSVDSSVTQRTFVGSSVISLVSSTVSSSRDLSKSSSWVSVSIVLEGDHSQTCLILKRNLSERESLELYQCQFESRNQKPVIWPPNLLEDSISLLVRSF